MPIVESLGIETAPGVGLWLTTVNEAEEFLKMTSTRSRWRPGGGEHVGVGEHAGLRGHLEWAPGETAAGVHARR